MREGGGERKVRERREREREMKKLAGEKFMYRQREIKKEEKRIIRLRERRKIRIEKYGEMNRRLYRRCERNI